MFQGKIAAALLAAASAATAGSAWAAGIEYPDNGTIAIGRGGAWAANPSDGMAFQYNPAGLAQQRGWNVMVDARLAQQNVKFTSTSIKGDPATNQGKPFLGPSVAASYGLGAAGPFSDLTLALGVTGPSAIGKVEYPKEGVQRYALHSTDYFIGYYSAAVAAAWRDWLRFGVTLQAAHGSATFDQAVYSGTFEGANDPKQDSYATFSGSNTVTPAMVAGLTLTPHPDWAIGLSFRPGLAFTADGTLKTQVPDAVKDSSKQVGDQAQLQLHFPDVIRAGVQWRPQPSWEVELDAVVERWSALKEVRVHTKNVTVVTTFDPANPIKVPDIVFPHDFKDTVSLRLGAEKILSADLRVRGGYLHETSAAPSKYVSVDFPNWARDVASVGASYRVGKAWVDVAYAHHFVQTQTVTDSAVVQQETPAVLPGVPAPKPQVVGNGTYEASMNIVSLAVRVPFGKSGD